MKDVVFLVVFPLVAFGVYLGKCVVMPWKACQTCEGSGRRASGKVWGDCRVCGGSGRRQRFGRWLLNRLLSRG